MVFVSDACNGIQTCSFSNIISGLLWDVIYMSHSHFKVKIKASVVHSIIILVSCYPFLPWQLKNASIAAVWTWELHSCIIRPHRMHRIDVACCYASYASFVYPSVGHISEPCKNSWTDWDAIGGRQTCGPQNHVSDGGVLISATWWIWLIICVAAAMLSVTTITLSTCPNTLCIIIVFLTVCQCCVC